MRAPQWITGDDALANHDMMLAQHGGRPGLRDAGMFDSALQRPQQLLNHAHATLSAMAAAYAGGIVRNHPFIDGNKRTASSWRRCFWKSTASRSARRIPWSCTRYGWPAARRPKRRMRRGSRNQSATDPRQEDDEGPQPPRFTPPSRPGRPVARGSVSPRGVRCAERRALLR